MANFRSRRIAALESMANAPERIIQEIVIMDDGRVMQNYGGFILPPPMTAEEWEAAAKTQQAELCKRIAHAKP